MGQQKLDIISPNELLDNTMRLKNAGYRLVAISCTFKNGIELTYSFDESFELLNLRLNIDADVEIESISCIYPYAFLYENEIKELFGVNIQNISVDFNNNLYKIAVKTPFNTKEENE
ncbi:MAG: NADH-quinone oxidoreductase subunit C [Clostridia bacterium]